MDSQKNLQTSNSMLMGILAYLGILVVVSYFFSKDDAFVKFHVKQGLLLFIGEVIVWVLASFLWSFLPLFQLLNLAILILAIIGIVNVVQKKEKELPIVGHLAKSFTF